MSDVTAKQRDMRRNFADRAEPVSYLKSEFPEAAAVDAHSTAVVGGRAAAETVLENIEAENYGGTRNYLDGAVTHLSPYIRHGSMTCSKVSGR